MDFVRVLFHMHLSQTVSENPPFTHTITGIKNDNININKLYSFTNETVKTFSEECYKIFTDRYPRCLKGSVDADPHIWTIIAVRHLKQKIYENSPAVFVFPNGCCNRDICSINLFYEIIVEELLTVKKIINTNDDIIKMYGKEICNQP